MLNLSKSKIISFLQCPKRMWLEIHRPELKEDSASAQARFKVGHQVGEIARKLYDPAGDGVLIDIKSEGFGNALKRSAALLKNPDQPIFEAGFESENTVALADVMVPVSDNGQFFWKMVEVKSSASVKDYHRDDVSIQSFLARSMGVPISFVAVAHVDTSWVYPGGNDYNGLLLENDLTEETLERSGEVEGWIRDAHRVAKQKSEPERETGDHCYDPFECGFCQYCNRDKIAPEYPIDWLPRLSPRQRSRLEELNVEDLRHVPENLLNPTQKLVRDHTLNSTTFFDRRQAKASLKGTGLPACFLDFETINLTVPVWAGTRPYQQIPFQFSLHKVKKDLTLEHREFLDLSGEDPSRQFAEAVIAACEKRGPVFVYNAGFESGVLNSLAKRFPDIAPALEKVIDRIVDLLPIARECFYHPSQQGSWSIKSVLPAAVPELSYELLDGVKDGTMAMEAFAEAIHPDTETARKEKIRSELRAYCRLDTLAMVGLWKYFLGLIDPKI